MNQVIPISYAHTNITSIHMPNYNIVKTRQENSSRHVSSKNEFHHTQNLPYYLALNSLYYCIVFTCIDLIIYFLSKSSSNIFLQQIFEDQSHNSLEARIDIPGTW